MEDSQLRPCNHGNQRQPIVIQATETTTRSEKDAKGVKKCSSGRISHPGYALQVQGEQVRINGDKVSVKLLQAQADNVSTATSCQIETTEGGVTTAMTRRQALTCTSATASCSSASARALISLLLITLLKSDTHTHTQQTGLEDFRQHCLL